MASARLSDAATLRLRWSAAEESKSVDASPAGVAGKHLSLRGAGFDCEDGVVGFAVALGDTVHDVRVEEVADDGSKRKKKKKKGRKKIRVRVAATAAISEGVVDVCWDSEFNDVVVGRRDGAVVRLGEASRHLVHERTLCCFQRSSEDGFATVGMLTGVRLGPERLAGPRSSRPTCCCIPKHKHVAVGYADGVVAAYDARAKNATSILAQLGEPIFGLAATREGNIIAVGVDGAVCVASMDSSSILMRRRITPPVESMCLVANSTLVHCSKGVSYATCLSDDVEVVIPCGGVVRRVAASGEFVAILSWDGTLRVSRIRIEKSGPCSARSPEEDPGSGMTLRARILRLGEWKDRRDALSRENEAVMERLARVTTLWSLRYRDSSEVAAKVQVILDRLAAEAAFEGCDAHPALPCMHDMLRRTGRLRVTLAPEVLRKIGCSDGSWSLLVSSRNAGEPVGCSHSAPLRGKGIVDVPLHVASVRPVHIRASLLLRFSNESSPGASAELGEWTLDAIDFARPMQPDGVNCQRRLDVSETIAASFRRHLGGRTDNHRVASVSTEIPTAHSISIELGIEESPASFLLRLFKCRGRISSLLPREHGRIAIAEFTVASGAACSIEVSSDGILVVRSMDAGDAIALRQAIAARLALLGGELTTGGDSTMRIEQSCERDDWMLGPTMNEHSALANALDAYVSLRK